MSLRQQLKGTGVALVTPFNDRFEVDYNALGGIIDHVINGGVEYVVTLGTTGETPTLDKQEKIDIANFTFEKVGGRVPVVVGIGGNNTREIIKELECFPLDKAIAVLSASPYYSKPSQEGIFQHYKAIGEASPKPILLYNVPGRTGRNMTAETTIRLSHEKNIGGIKEAADDMMQCMQLLRDAPEDFLVVSGDDGLALGQVAYGMDGVISVIANTFPKHFSDMIRLGLKNEFPAARAINNRLVEAYNLLFAENNPAGVKAFMAQQSLLENKLRLPVTPVSDALYQKIAGYLKTV
ncbi:4-hydroxy-tetrahydrodipicolinate synthase [Filimonas effusa]|uniref:4-hydroxy-tetrahydrodipicolinate synthase n=1 Tax=Filimonas effusa TaxID=2508721 RepID=A0A4Q1D8W6_9BACT|nr:4-hydroxy-tetrahydrodipicolinate synthase [Filimonas effusa]RXK85792.1 4-hydroxy-tetrahydrodipicolinate synthase [Filimonas effusa]